MKFIVVALFLFMFEHACSQAVLKRSAPPNSLNSLSSASKRGAKPSSRNAGTSKTGAPKAAPGILVRAGQNSTIGSHPRRGGPVDSTTAALNTSAWLVSAPDRFYKHCEYGPSDERTTASSNLQFYEDYRVLTNRGTDGEGRDALVSE